MKKSLLLSALLLGTALCASAQDYTEGYVVFKAGDTLRCLIREQAVQYTSVEIKSLTGDRPMTYRPGEVSSFFLKETNALYVEDTVNIDLKPFETANLQADDRQSKWDRQILFLRVLVKGTANLLYYQDEKRKQHYFLQMPEDTEPKELVLIRYYYTARSMAVEMPNFREQLKKAFVGCPGDYTTTPYTMQSLRKVVQDYNKCKGDKPAFVSTEVGMTSSVYVMLGAVSQSAKFTGYAGGSYTYSDKEDFGTSISPVVAAGVEFGSKRSSNHISAAFELAWRKNSYSKPNTEHSYSFTNLSILVKYRFNGALSPYLKVGGVVGLYSAQKNVYHYNFATPTLAPFGSLGYGFAAAAGLSGQRWLGEVRYDLYLLTAPAYKATWQASGIGVSVGYRLKEN